MKPPAFKYVAAETVEEATARLAEYGDEARPIAGGQSLVPMMNFRLVSPAVLVDIRRIAPPDAIEEANGHVRVGALTRHRSLETSPLIRDRFPVLAAAMGHVAHLAIRNRGTIGGSLCHADPAAELPALAVLLDARIHAASCGGERVVEAGSFFEGALWTALDDGEIVTRIDFPLLPPGTGWGFHEFARRHGDFGLAGAAATVTGSAGRAAEVRIALFGVGETPVRAAAAEALLTGTGLEPDAVAAAVEAVRGGVDPGDDLHASADYRRHLAGVMAERALGDAWARVRARAGARAGNGAA
ncbi:MAG: xanthine dehydrogenase family protein subunit M [Rhodospirillaceae bacterium]|nr:xanthine dehydrogenase family protein subunit M [Rhodospirillaceae bacterium]